MRAFLGFGVIVSLLLPPLAQGEEDLWPCDYAPETLVRWWVDHGEDWALAQINPYLTVVGDAAALSGKAKCTVLEVLGICSDESIVPASWVVTSTGSAHPHRSECFEYFATGPYQGCKTGEKVWHKSAGGVDTHRCVIIGWRVPF